ncbi:MAG: methylated-DNA--[protein]-cysteine S-methyltransferase [Actinomycetota bacterium]|nr:methylated-DNA--[protein]-cysteine S-methyltransferase [Actinomycetota bacterium]
MFYSATFDTPIGSLEICASRNGLRRILLPGRECDNREESAIGNGDHPLLARTIEEISQYFDGERERFSLPLDLKGTEFQMKVWESLASIKYGSTSTYSGQAKRIGRPKAARAVGAANAVNPLPIILPCHRVIGVNGALTGYGGGSSLLHIKQFLLDLEKANSSPR